MATDETSARTEANASAAIEPAARSPWGHRVMFLLLILLAFVLYAPAVLLPMLRSHKSVLDEEKMLTADLGELETEVAKAERLVVAFRSDPAVNEQLAQLDLNYQRPGERTLPVSPEAAAAPPTRVLPPPDRRLVPANWPRWAHTAERFADRYRLPRIFLTAPTRGVLLLMSGGLLVAAFVLYPPTPRAGRPRPIG